ncbi:hypothetical protein AB0J80_10990 [Actinoplanes sp. NPDC049548]|uniref:hypothetical protein n=1 Tax=Actinoplanes sp. NPDC049548 TaxID=3155152 RepID=UPI003418D4CC
MRRLLFFLSSAVLGAGLVILLSAGSGAGTWFGIAFCSLLVVGGAAGSRWGPGPVARGIRAPQLSLMSGIVLALSALAALLLLWRPSIGAGLPLYPFLGCVAVSALLLMPVGLMGDPQ